MFDFIPNGLTVLLSLLFPIYASHKALSSPSPDPATAAEQQTSWLTYFLVLTLVTAIEAILDPITSWLPLFAWLRLLLRLWLLVPGPDQGAGYVYNEHVAPFLKDHEEQIERFIGRTLETIKSRSASSSREVVDWLKVNVLGMPPSKPTAQAVPQSRGQAFAQSLLERFSLTSATSTSTSARPQVPAPVSNAAGDIYGMLSSALQAATSAATGAGASAAPAVRSTEELISAQRDAKASNVAAAGSLVPPSITSPRERATYIRAQKERLAVLMRAFDKEEAKAPAQEQMVEPKEAGYAGMKKSLSETEFDTISYEEVGAGAAGKSAAQTTSGAQPSSPKAHSRWSSWLWAGKETSSEDTDNLGATQKRRISTGKATGSDVKY